MNEDDRYLLWLAPLVGTCCLVLVVSFLAHVGEPQSQWLVCEFLGFERACW